MLGNLWWFDWGKLLLSILDCIAGILLAMLYIILGTFKNVKNPEKSAILWSSIWLLNPFVINISTRGSIDVIIITLIYLFLVLILLGYLRLSALLYGFIVHMRIYPVIYSISICLYIYKTSNS